MNKGKIFEHLHGLGLNGEQSLKVLQLIGGEVLKDVRERVFIASRSFQQRARVVQELGGLYQELGLNFDEHKHHDDETTPPAPAVATD